MIYLLVIDFKLTALIYLLVIDFKLTAMIYLLVIDFKLTALIYLLVIDFKFKLTGVIYLLVIDFKFYLLCHQMGSVFSEVNRLQLLIGYLPSNQQGILGIIQAVELLLGKPAV